MRTRRQDTPSIITSTRKVHLPLVLLHVQVSLTASFSEGRRQRDERGGWTRDTGRYEYPFYESPAFPPWPSPFCLQLRLVGSTLPSLSRRPRSRRRCCPRLQSGCSSWCFANSSATLTHLMPSCISVHSSATSALKPNSQPTIQSPPRGKIPGSSSAAPSTLDPTGASANRLKLKFSKAAAADPRKVCHLYNLARCSAQSYTALSTSLYLRWVCTHEGSQFHPLYDVNKPLSVLDLTQVLIAEAHRLDAAPRGQGNLNSDKVDFLEDEVQLAISAGSFRSINL